MQSMDKSEDEWSVEQHELVLAAVCELNSLNVIQRHDLDEKTVRLEVTKFRFSFANTIGALHLVLRAGRPISIVVFHQTDRIFNWSSHELKIYNVTEHDGEYDASAVGRNLLSYYLEMGLIELDSPWAHNTFQVEDEEEGEAIGTCYSTEHTKEISEYIQDQLDFWKKYDIAPSHGLPKGEPPYWGLTVEQWNNHEFVDESIFSNSHMAICTAAALDVEWGKIYRCENGEAEWVLESKPNDGIKIRAELHWGSIHDIKIGIESYKDEWSYNSEFHEISENSDCAAIAATITARALFCLGGHGLDYFEHLSKLSISYTQRLEWQLYFCEKYPRKLWPSDWKRELPA